MVTLFFTLFLYTFRMNRDCEDRICWASSKRRMFEWSAIGRAVASDGCLNGWWRWAGGRSLIIGPKMGRDTGPTRPKSLGWLWAEDRVYCGPKWTNYWSKTEELTSAKRQVIRVGTGQQTYKWRVHYTWGVKQKPVEAVHGWYGKITNWCVKACDKSLVVRVSRERQICTLRTWFWDYFSRISSGEGLWKHWQRRQAACSGSWGAWLDGRMFLAMRVGTWDLYWGWFLWRCID